MATTFAVFGVSPDSSVWLLNDLKNGMLDRGVVQRASWNEFIRSSTTEPLDERVGVLEYACLVYGLVEGGFPAQPCNAEEKFTVTRTKRGEWRVSFGLLRRSFVITQRRQLVAATDLTSE